MLPSAIGEEMHVYLDLDYSYYADGCSGPSGDGLVPVPIAFPSAGFLAAGTLVAKRLDCYSHFWCWPNPLLPALGPSCADVGWLL